MEGHARLDTGGAEKVRQLFSCHHVPAHRQNPQEADTPPERQHHMFKPFRIIAAAAVLLLGLSAVFAQDDAEADVTFNLSTAIGGFEQGAFAFMGTEGDLEGVDNPDLVVKVGQTVRVVLTVGPDGMEHDFYLDEFDVASDSATPGNDVVVTFVANEAGEYEYYCAIPGHREGGMYGKFIVEE